MKDDLEYNIKCEICGTETSVVVLDEVNEKPVFCCMCGEDAEVTEV